MAGISMGGGGDVTEVVSHTLVAILVLIGGFTLMVISVVTGHVIPDNDMTLITVLMSGVTGWYFGTRSALSGVHVGQQPAASPAPVEAPGTSTTAGT